MPSVPSSESDLRCRFCRCQTWANHEGLRLRWNIQTRSVFAVRFPDTLATNDFDHDPPCQDVPSCCSRATRVTRMSGWWTGVTQKAWPPEASSSHCARLYGNIPADRGLLAHHGVGSGSERKGETRCRRLLGERKTQTSSGPPLTCLETSCPGMLAALSFFLSLSLYTNIYIYIQIGIPGFKPSENCPKTTHGSRSFEKPFHLEHRFSLGVRAAVATAAATRQPGTTTVVTSNQVT